MKQIKQNYEYILHERCQRCGRKLKTIESQRLGYGKSCYKKYKIEGIKYRTRRLF